MSIQVTTTHGTHEAALEIYLGRILSLDDNRLESKSDAGSVLSHKLAHDVIVTDGGRPAERSSLKVGCRIRVTVRKDDAALALRIDLAGVE